MNVGYNCFIDDKWIPKHISTGMLDMEGKEIMTSNVVMLCGCTSTKAIVGKSERGFELFFGSENGSVGWSLNNEVIKEHKIKVFLTQIKVN